MFDVTTRCQHCGDTRRNHKGRACKAPSAAREGKTFTPWTVEAYAQAEAQGRAAAEFMGLAPRTPGGPK